MSASINQSKLMRSLMRSLKFASKQEKTLYCTSNKMLSYRRETALQAAL